MNLRPQRVMTPANAILCIALICIALFVSSALAEPSLKDEPSPEVQREIVRAYSSDHCDEVKSLSANLNVEHFRPNVMAIAAFCEIPGRESERLFELAESKDSTGDLILLLHGLYRCRDSQKCATANPIWEKVLMYARNPYFRAIARDYLAGKPADVKNLNLSPNVAYLRLWTGGYYKTDPRLLDLIYLDAQSSSAMYLYGDVNYRSWTAFGSWGVRHNMRYDAFFTEWGLASFENVFEAPIALRVTPSKDLIFSPIGGLWLVGQRIYKYHYGAAVKGVVYKSDYVQSVQGMVFSDDYTFKEIDAQKGAHYRFEYQWDHFDVSDIASLKLFVEHVSSSKSNEYLNQRGTFEMSHTDMGLSLQFERAWSALTLGVAPSAVFRVNTDDSIYTRKDNGQSYNQQRQDWTLNGRVYAYIPILPKLSLNPFYEVTKVYSNFGPGDFINRNYFSQMIGLGVRTVFSTY